MTVRPKGTKIEITGSNTSEWVPMIMNGDDFKTGAFISAPPGVSGDIFVEVASDPDFENAPSYTIHTHDLGDPVTLLPSGTRFISILHPAPAVRFRANNVIGGNVEIRVWQTGPVTPA